MKVHYGLQTGAAFMQGMMDAYTRQMMMTADIKKAERDESRYQKQWAYQQERHAVADRQWEATHNLQRKKTEVGLLTDTHKAMSAYNTDFSKYTAERNKLMRMANEYRTLDNYENLPEYRDRMYEIEALDTKWAALQTNYQSNPLLQGFFHTEQQPSQTTSEPQGEAPAPQEGGGVPYEAQATRGSRPVKRWTADGKEMMVYEDPGGGYSEIGPNNRPGRPISESLSAQKPLKTSAESFKAVKETTAPVSERVAALNQGLMTRIGNYFRLRDTSHWTPENVQREMGRAIEDYLRDLPGVDEATFEQYLNEGRIPKQIAQRMRANIINAINQESLPPGKKNEVIGFLNNMLQDDGTFVRSSLTSEGVAYSGGKPLVADATHNEFKIAIESAAGVGFEDAPGFWNKALQIGRHISPGLRFITPRTSLKRKGYFAPGTPILGETYNEADKKELIGSTSKPGKAVEQKMAEFEGNDQALIQWVKTNIGTISGPDGELPEHLWPTPYGKQLIKGLMVHKFNQVWDIETGNSTGVTPWDKYGKPIHKKAIEKTADLIEGGINAARGIPMKSPLSMPDDVPNPAGKSIMPGIIGSSYRRPQQQMLIR